MTRNLSKFLGPFSHRLIVLWDPRLIFGYVVQFFLLYKMIKKYSRKNGRVTWENSDQKSKNSFCFFSFSFVVHCKEVIFGPQLEQSVLYQLVKESPEKHVLEKSYSRNGKSPIELIRITPFGVTRISQSILSG